MFDTMTITKATGAVCGSLLAFLLMAWAGEALYTVGGGHGEDHAAAYVIETGSGDAAEDATAEAAPDFGVIYASADAAAGEKVFAKCKACHKLDGELGTGPYLNGVVDRPKAAVDGFAYSDALMAMASDAWTPENMSAFLTNPKDYAPGNKMSFAGLPKVEDRANVIAYLATNP